MVGLTMDPYRITPVRTITWERPDIKISWSPKSGELKITIPDEAVTLTATDLREIITALQDAESYI